MSTTIEQNARRVRQHYREFWSLHGRDVTPPPLAGDGRPPIMNIGYWGGGAVTAREAQAAFVRQLADRLPNLRGQRVLDAGCGVGGPASLLALEYGAQVDAVNIIPEQVELARSYAAAQGIGDRARFHVANAMQLPFDEQAFDAVFSLEAAHCFIDKPRFVRETYRVLRPGGLIVLADMTATLDVPLARRLPALGLDLVTAEAWRRMVAEAGFELLEHRLMGSAIYPSYRRWLRLTARERRRTILASLTRNDGAAGWRGIRRAEAWVLELVANRSVSVVTSALGLREYVLMVARRPSTSPVQ